MDIGDIDPALCVPCKGARALCGISPCPLLQQVQHHMPQVNIQGRHLSGTSPPAMFVGRYGYPKVSIGPMLPPTHMDPTTASALDDPTAWMDDSIVDVIGRRSALLRTKHTVGVTTASKPDRITDLVQELAVAARPVDTEVRLSRIPHMQVPKFTEWSAPHGPSVDLEMARLEENATRTRRMEAVVGDTDLRATEALQSLHAAGTPQVQLERVLMSGMVGLGKRRRFVPTRWAITATDDTLAEPLRQQIRDFPTIDKPRIHVARRFGNQFYVLLLPRVWGFELVETWLKGAFWAREVVPANDWEDYGGRTQYARNTTGGYYATRLPILEHLASIRKQATAIVLREIDDEYTTPLGVWVVRETTKLAMASKPMEFDSMDLALKHMDRRARHHWRASAPFLERILHQPNLDSFT